MNTDDENFLDDAAKTNPDTEDALGYAPFAKRLAASLHAISADNGYVVGLQGPWGSGKTTALNFVRYYLEKLNENCRSNRHIEVLDFRPWIVSGHEDMISSFFKVLAEGINPGEAAKRARTTGAWRAAKAIADPALKAAATLGTAAVPVGGAGFGAAATIANKSFGALVDRWLATPSLQSAYDDLRTALEEKKRRYLVIIDDLDRLQPGEIRTIMQMVKSVGSLPFVTYLLAYDRRIIETALDGAGVRSAADPRYADKIIQHEVPLPHPAQTRLLRLLNDATSFLIGSTEDDLRWFTLLQFGITRWIRSARDVTRLANAVLFLAPALEGEFDPQDLLIMEGLRLFEFPVFDWVRKNRDFLFKDGRFQIDREGDVVSKREQLHALVEEAERPSIIALLCALFPLRSKDITGKDQSVFGFGAPSYASVSARRGIGSKEGFDAYFGMGMAAGTVSKRDVDALLAEDVNEKELASILDRYLLAPLAERRNLSSEFLQQVYYRFEMPHGVWPSAIMLRAFLERGEPVYELDEQADGVIARASFTYSQVLRELLGRMGLEAAGNAAVAALTSNIAPIVAADFFNARARELGVLPTKSSVQPPAITKDALEAIGQQTRGIIEEAVGAGSLRNAPAFWQIYQAWSFLAGRDASREWLRSEAKENAHSFAKVALGYLSWSLGGRKRQYEVTTRPSEDLFTLREMRELADVHRADPTLSEDESARLDALRTGVERVLSQPPEDPSSDPFDGA